jgi:outer membrane lipoprotein SlyB
MIFSMLMLTACARHGQIIIDPKGVDMGQYHTDLAECRQLAEQVDPKTGKGIVAGAVIGGVVGEIVGGGNRTRIGASLGALKGGLRGGAATRHERTRVIKNCLRNRGYQILN